MATKVQMQIAADELYVSAKAIVTEALQTTDVTVRYNKVLSARTVLATAIREVANAYGMTNEKTRDLIDVKNNLDIAFDEVRREVRKA